MLEPFPEKSQILSWVLKEILTDSFVINSYDRLSKIYTINLYILLEIYHMWLDVCVEQVVGGVARLHCLMIGIICSSDSFSVCMNFIIPSFFFFNSQFLDKVEEKFPKDAELIVACQKGLRWDLCIQFDWLHTQLSCL